MLLVKSDIDGKGKRLVTTQAIKKDEVVYALKNYEVITSPTYTSVQISQTQSIGAIAISFENKKVISDRLYP